MLRSPPLRSAWQHYWPLSVLLLVPACFVSFNDYPLADTSDGAGAAPSGGSAGAGSSSGGSAAGIPSSEGGSAAGLPSSEGGNAGEASAAPSMIDDFEDGDQHILEDAGRSGSWYTANDGRGDQSPRPGMTVLPSALMPARGDSDRGLHTTGGPFETWGALIGTALASNNGVGAAYDLSGYRGIRLWVRSGPGSGSGPGGAPLAQQVRLNLSTPATETGGGCTMCGDHFGFDVPLTSQWQPVEVMLAEARQAGFGRPQLTSAPDWAHVTGLELFFPQDVRFDLWVDDIELF